MSADHKPSPGMTERCHRNRGSITRLWSTIKAMPGALRVFIKNLLNGSDEPCKENVRLGERSLRRKSLTCEGKVR
ncbi:hypothetical protein JTB14_032179 [Gonioctena quinquepunctata]|nr:hypothetical protein JTB14_032179 [Gonioctena quinquepunctata]